MWHDFVVGLGRNTEGVTARLQGSEEKLSKQEKEDMLQLWKHRSLIAKCPYEIKDNKYKKDKKEEKADHKKSKKYMGEAHIGHEWDSTKEGTSEEDEKVATISIHKSSPIPRLFNFMFDDDYYSLTFVSWQRVRR